MTIQIKARLFKKAGLLNQGHAMSVKLDRKTVVNIATLARLKLSDVELDNLTNQMTIILDYVRMLDEVDTSEVEPMAHAVEQTNVFHEDEPHESLPREEALSNAPKTDGQYFLVPSILQQP